MELDYEYPRLETFLRDERALRKAHGAEVVKRLAIRFTTIRESSNLAELHLQPGHTRPLSGNRAELSHASWCNPRGGRVASDLPTSVNLFA